MEIIQAPNKFVPKDNHDRIFVYLSGTKKNGLIEYININISKTSIKKVDKMVILDPKNEIEKKTEDEIKEQIKWEDENAKMSDIYSILFDETDNCNNKNFYDLGKYLSFFYDIYKNDINQHCIIAYMKGFKHEIFLKNEINSFTKGLVEPMKINDISVYGDAILNKLDTLYKLTDQFVEHNVIHTDNEHYWSINLGPYIKKLFCQSPWPHHHFTIGIMGIVGIGKTCIYRRMCEGRYARTYEYCIGGASSLYQVEFNNKNFIVGFEDTGGQERFLSSMITKNLVKKNCIIFVFDITDRESFEFIINDLYPQIKNLVDNNSIRVLIGNKLDLKYKRVISNEEIDKFADDNNLKYFEISAKSGENFERFCNYVYNSFSKQI
jgi:small GTP-binding protein